MALITHLAAQRLSLPFVHMFDGMRTSHEYQKVEMLDYEEIAELVDMECIYEFKKTAMNPENPHIRGLSQAPDIYFQLVEAANCKYKAVVSVVKEMMDKVGEATGRHYKPFDYYGHEEPDRVLVLFGSGAEVAEEVVDYINKNDNERVGVIKVRLFRPWSVDEFEKMLPKSVEKMAVLDRTKEHGSWSEPLLLEVAATLKDRRPDITLVGGRYGLGGKDFKPTNVMSIFDELKTEKPMDDFTVGIMDDVCGRSLKPLEKRLTTTPAGTVRCVFWGTGGDGTVGANQKAIEIIGNNTDLQVQAFFQYDAKKSRGMTKSHLRFGKEPIKSTYPVANSDFIACHVQNYVNNYDLLETATENSVFVLNSPWNTVEEMGDGLPAEMKKKIAEMNIKVYNIDAQKIALELGLEGRINMIMQSVFFHLSEVLPVEQSLELLKESIVKEFSKKGEDIVNMNLEAVDQTIDAVVEIDYDHDEWINAEEEEEEGDSEKVEIEDKFEKIIDKCGRWKANGLSVSAFEAGGRFPTGTMKLEKRGLTIEVPKWIPDNCVQCNSCAFVCPHAVIRPFLFTEEDLQSDNVPEGFETLDCNDKKLSGYKVRIQPSVLDCTGCANCFEACPTDPKALEMEQFFESGNTGKENWEFCISIPHKNLPESVSNPYTPKGLAFRYPYLEFHGGCAGCGETTYVKLATQLYGDHMVIANASGCSSIWGGSAPSCPYTVDEAGNGPTWGNSLFEDNAEYGFGMAKATKHERAFVRKNAEIAVGQVEGELKECIQEWLDNYEDMKKSRDAGDKIRKIFEETPEVLNTKELKEMDRRSQLFTKFSFWMIGGDGWAYDIGIGGLIHAMASTEDINAIVLDTEVYSNTGGQASKSTQLGAVAKFAAGGKNSKKMDLGKMIMSIGSAYVASVSLGANRNQYLKVLKEAVEFDGPSLILCYAPCIAHGYQSMRYTQLEEEEAVKSGYWPLYRYNPHNEKGERFSLDSKKVDFDLLNEFLDREVRHRSLNLQFPERWEQMRNELKEGLIEKHEDFLRMQEWI